MIYVIMHHIEVILAYNEGEGAIVPNVPNMTFTKEDLRGMVFPHSYPLVMTIDIDAHEVRKVLINGGASFNVLYKQTFERMTIENKIFMVVVTPTWALQGMSSSPTEKSFSPLLSLIAMGFPEPQKSCMWSIVHLLITAL